MEPTAPDGVRQSASVWVNLSIDRSAGDPLQRQLYDQIRAEILRGTLPPGTRLPASRLLASEVGCEVTPRFLDTSGGYFGLAFAPD
jgi:hypothetical protein